ITDSGGHGIASKCEVVERDSGGNVFLSRQLGILLAAVSRAHRSARIGWNRLIRVRVADRGIAVTARWPGDIENSQLCLDSNGTVRGSGRILADRTRRTSDGLK